jgi:nucleotide-binding universal stress UspA family protein
MSIRRMLMPVALESRDDALLAFACGLHRQGVRELLVAHVVDGTGLEFPVVVKSVERAREKLLGMVEPYASCGMKIEVRVVMGSVVREVSALVHQASIDVICCGTEGKSFVDYLFAGSVSEDLALKGDERTMTVRWDLIETPERAGEVAAEFAQRLVVPTDFSASSMRAVMSAFERPSEALGTVHLLHVAEGDTADAEAQMRGLTAMAAEYGATAVSEIRRGDPAEVVLDYVREIGATGIITGRKGRGALSKALVGSVSLRLMKDAPCPVVIQP